MGYDIVEATCTGRMTVDPQLKLLTTQKECCNFSVACSSRSAKNNDATFVNCSAYGATARFLATYVNKGDYVFVRGDLSNTRYYNRKGELIQTYHIIVKNFKILTKKRPPTQESVSAYEETMFDSGGGVV